MSKALKRRCAICKRSFVPTRSWQKYDRTACRLKAFHQRTYDRIRAEVLREIGRTA